MTPEEVKKLIEEAVAKATAALTDEFKKKFQAVEEKNSELEETNKQFSAKMMVHTAATTLADARLFSAQMKTEQKLPPAVLNAGFTEFIASLDGNRKLTFAAASGEETQLEAAKRLFSAMPSQGKLFKSQAEDARGNESDADAELEKFAAKEGIDPKLFQANFNAIKDSAAPKL